MPTVEPLGYREPMPAIDLRQHGRALAVAAFVVLLALDAWMAPRFGATLLFAIAVLIGPLSLATWLAFQRPIAIFIGIYAALAPLDYVLANGGTSYARLISFAAIAILSLNLFVSPARHALPRFAVCWFLVLAWMTASVSWALDQGVAIDKLEQIALAALVFGMVVLSRPTRLDLMVVVGAVVLAGLGISVYSIASHPFENYQNTTRLLIQNGQYSINPDALGAALIPAFAFALAWATSTGFKPWVRLAAATAVPLLSYAIFAAGSRGGVIAWVAVVLWVTLRARSRIVSYAMVAIVAVLAATQSALWVRFSADDPTGAGRTDIWKVGLESLRHFWAIGCGIGNFPVAFNQFYLTVPHHFYIGWSRPAHNMVLSAFVELGIVGVSLVLSAWWLQFRALSVIKRSDSDYWLRVGAEGATLGYFIAALFIDVLDVKETWVIPMVIALVVGVRAGSQVANRAPAAALRLREATA